MKDYKVRIAYSHYFWTCMRVALSEYNEFELTIPAENMQQAIDLATIKLVNTNAAYRSFLRKTKAPLRFHTVKEPFRYNYKISREIERTNKNTTYHEGKAYSFFVAEYF